MDADAVAHWVSPDGRCVAEGRALARVRLAEFGLAPELLGQAELAASELLSNALVHGAPPVSLLVWRGRRWIVVEVHDAAGRAPDLSRCRALGDVGPLATSGRGLALVAALSAGRCGTLRLPEGNSVWFALPTARRLPAAPKMVAVVQARARARGHARVAA